MNFIVIMLKGFSEVFFQENPILGIFILIGLTIVSPISALLAVIGSIAGNITGGFLETNKGLHESGVYGLNGILIGTAMGYFLKNLPLSIGIVLIGSIVAACISYLLLKNHIFPLALPFVIVTLSTLAILKYFKLIN